MEDRITAQEAAQLLGISVAALHRLCGRGTLAYTWFAGRRVFQRQLVLALKNSEVYHRRTRSRTFAQLLKDGTIKQGAMEI